MSFTLICHRAINNNNRAMTFASSASDAAAAAAVPQYEQIGLYRIPRRRRTRVIINIILYDLSYHDLFMFQYMTQRHTQTNKYKSNENRNSCD